MCPAISPVPQIFQDNKIRTDHKIVLKLGTTDDDYEIQIKADFQHNPISIL